MRKLLLKTLAISEKEAMEALCRRWNSTKHVQDMVELLAKLEGKLSKDAADGSRGVGIIVLNNTGAQPLDPETFRAAALRRMSEIEP